nr:MAG TPA: hypothetical protein [Caudoviricetes sp.]
MASSAKINHRLFPFINCQLESGLFLCYTNSR